MQDKRLFPRKSWGDSMGIFDALERWRFQRDALRLSEPVGLVVHTSWVNFREDDLRRMSASPYLWLTPDSVRYELQFLTVSTVFGAKARLLLSILAEQPRCAAPAWDLEQLYQGSHMHREPQDLFDGTIVFAFGDLNKQDEFLRCVSGFDAHHIVMLSGWSCMGAMSVYSIREATNASFRPSCSLDSGQPAPPIREIASVRDAVTGERLFSGNSLQPTDLVGSYGRIFESPYFKGKYIKIYHQQAVSGIQGKKLRVLQSLAPHIRTLPIATPERLLGTDLPSVHDGALIGYIMPKCEGSALRDYVLTGWEGHDLELILKRLILLLLELHNLHIIVNDLSGNNILIDDSDHVSIVDCDSFQLLHYPGGAVTEIYRHPEISSQHFRDSLREPRHEYFAFAVLVFQCLFYDIPLRQRQDTAEDIELNWTNASFPLDVITGPEQAKKANPDILRLWEQQPEAIRRIFSDEFLFRGDHSLGAWIRALEL